MKFFKRFSKKSNKENLFERKVIISESQFRSKIAEAVNTFNNSGVPNSTVDSTTSSLMTLHNNVFGLLLMTCIFDDSSLLCESYGDDLCIDDLIK